MKISGITGRFNVCNRLWRGLALLVMLAMVLNGGLVPIREVSAETTYTLTVTSSGNGTVTRNPDLQAYPAGTSVTLTANPNAGWSFYVWSGDVTGPQNPTTIVMNGNRSVTANFVQKAYTLTTNISGLGTVEKEPFQETYKYGDVVTLTAIPNESWVFVQWSTGETDPVKVVTIHDSIVLIAYFDPAGSELSYAIDVFTEGGGIVTREPDLVEYQYGTTVTLTALPDSEWAFEAWLDAETGEMLGTQPVLTLVVNAYRMIIAQFVESTTEMGKAQTIEILTEAKTGYKRVDSEIDRIIRNINASLAPELWIDGSRLVFKPKIDWVKEMEAQFKKKGYTVKDEEIDDERYSAKCMPPGKRSGITVFHEERKAAIHMETLLKIYQRELDTSKKDLKEKWKKHFDDLKKAKISNLIKNKIKIVVPRWGTRPDIRDRQAEIQAKINAIAAFKKVLPVLVMVDENLARVAFEDFQNVQPNNPDRWGEHINRELLRSESDYLKGVELGAAEKYSEAIKYFGRSWFHVQLAMQFALKK